jgi:hypothetical protein
MEIQAWLRITQPIFWKLDLKYISEFYERRFRVEGMERQLTYSGYMITLAFK